MRSKKVLTAAAFAILSTQALAQNSAYDDTRILSDPLYLPLQGQFYGETGYTYGSGSRDIFDSTGAHTDSVNTSLNALSQEILYGLTDDFALRLDWGYGMRTASRHPDSGGTVHRASSGWTDPSFGLVYRLMDQRDNPLTLDLHADYSPDAFTAKSAMPDIGGTIARGGQMFDVGARLGHVGPMFTVAGTFDAIWFGGQDVLNQNSGDLSRTEAVWNYRFGLMSQARLTDAFSVNAGVGHTFANNANVFNETTGIGHITQGGDFTDVNAALNYQFVPNTVVGSLEYQHNFYQNSRNIFPASPADSTSIRDKDEDLFGVRLRYAFQ